MMELRYILKGLLLPPFTQIILILVAWQLRRRAPKIAFLLGCVGIASLWALGTPVTADFLAKIYEQQVSAIAPKNLGQLKADAIVILSSGQNDSAPEFGQSVSMAGQLARIRYGAFLQRHTGLPVLLSGGSVFGDEQRSLAETMAFDFESGFGGKARWLEKNSRTTAENARNSYAILAAEQKTSIVLVTSAMHMPRALWVFKQQGFRVTPAPTDFHHQKPLTFISFLPNAEGLYLSSLVIHEWLGYFVYQLLERS